ncbi:mitochondrial fission 1 protein, partial [Lagopus leucura]|uniref:mitochondrial fission 1 protein n=1 Tax=Lagopus leucura TaxID=30410 RepID=UPI001C6679C0
IGQQAAKPLPPPPIADTPPRSHAHWRPWLHPQALERRYAEECQQGAPSRRSRFEYAWGLLRSRYNSDVQKGVAMFRELMADGAPEEQRDCVYYLAVGNYRLKEYEQALRFVRALLQAEPSNTQGLRLQQLIRARMHRGEPHRSPHSAP